MTREEAEKYLKYSMCSDCSIYLGGGKCSDNCRVIEAIRSLEQGPKIGHWTFYQNNKGDWINECSSCGLDAGVAYQYLYCPNCGAKMEEVENK